MKLSEKIRELVPLKSYIEERTELRFKPVGIWEDLEKCPFCGGHDCARFKNDAYYCFQCYVFCEDAIAFRKEFEKISYKEALEKFAQELRLKKDKNENGGIDWLSLRETACDYFVNTLFKCTKKYQFRNANKTPFNYLLFSRFHNFEAIMTFRIGFSDGKLIDFLKNKYAEDVIKASGLDKIPDGVFTYPVFADKTLKYFRLKDPNKIIKFQMPASLRGAGSYFFNQDSLKEGEEIWIVEGEDDVISLWEAGVSAVATMGGLNAQQIEFLKKKNPSLIYSCFDNDEAGELNTKRLVRSFPTETIYIVKFDGVKDIDELLRGKDNKQDIINELKSTAEIPKGETKSRIERRREGYFIEKGSEGHLFQLTNWTLEILSIIYSEADETSSWKCKLQFQGEEKELLINSSAFSNTRNLREFLLNQGKLLWFRGTDSDLSELINYFSITTNPKNVIECECVGFTKFGFISENLFLSEDGELKPLTNGFLSINENMSVKINPLVKRGSANSELPNFSLVEPVGGIDNFKSYVFSLLEKNRNLKSIIALGWARSTIFSNEFFEKKRFFPILMLHGKFSSGKSVLANWLMSILGMRNCNSEMLSDKGTSEIGLGRKLSYYSGLPVLIEDYRNDEAGKRFNTFLRACYDRTSLTKGIKSDFGVRRVIIRGCVLLTGEQAPSDPALFSRCVSIELTKAERNDKYYDEIVKLEPEFSSIGLDWLKRKNETKKDFFENYARFERILKEEIKDPRQAGCFAVALAGIVDELYKEREEELVDFVLKVIKQERESATQDETMHKLWECVDILYRKSQIDKHEIDYSFADKEIKISLPALMAKIRGSQWTRTYEFPTNREVAKLLKQEPYVVEFNKPVWVDGAVSKRWIIDLEKSPDILRDIFATQQETEMEQQEI